MTDYISYPFEYNDVVPQNLLLGWRGTTAVKSVVSLETIADSGAYRTLGFKLGAIDLDIDIPVAAGFPYYTRLYGLGYDINAVFGPGVLTASESVDLGLVVLPWLTIAIPEYLTSINGLTGDIEILAGNNARLSSTPESLTLAATPGWHYAEPSTSGINYVGLGVPDANGNLVITADYGLKITPDPDNHQLIFTSEANQEEVCSV
jgi:hypothetical protein